MAKQTVNPVEQHVEKAILGVTAVILVFVVGLFLFGRPNTLRIGTETLGPLLRAVLDVGMKSIRLDVAAANARAIACYRKCGMRITEEFWREHRGEPPQLDDPKWAFAAPHLREEDGKWMTRFYYMETP